MIFDKILRLVLMAALLGCVFVPQAEAAPQEKVLLDTDMTDMFDDGVAMMLLATSPQIKLMGVTTVTGNTWANDGVARAIRQLSALGIKNIPVTMGITPKTVRERFAGINKELEVFGRGSDAFLGAAGYDEPKDWKTAYRKNYGEEPPFSPVNENAVDFIIRTIKSNPGEVTIAAIGPMTNIEAAIKKAPEIVPLTKRIVYMGGAFFRQGNVTPAAEFNIWINPPAAKTVFRAPWKEQIFLSLDACEKMKLSRDEYFSLRRMIKNPIFAAMIDKNYIAQEIKNGAQSVYIWDILVAAVIMNPSVVKDEIALPIDVNDVYSPSYGQTLAYRGQKPIGAQEARIVTLTDRDIVVNMLRNLFDRL